MIHEQLDIAHWKSYFSVHGLRQSAEGKTPSVSMISGPYDIAVLEQLREASYAQLPEIERIPTDVFRLVAGRIPSTRSYQDWRTSVPGCRENPGRSRNQEQR